MPDRLTSKSKLSSSEYWEWNVEQEYVGDHHGTRLKHIFCAQSVGTP